MGWTHTRGATKQGVVEDRTRARTWNAGARLETLKHTVVGNTLWAVQRVVNLAVGGVDAEKDDGTPDAETFIACYLLENHAGYGWGYKDMCEEMHPYYYDCPLAYLELAPEKCPEWRAGVREFHAKRRELEGAQKNAVAALAVGQTVRLPDGCEPAEVRIVSLKPLLGEAGGQKYRIPKKMIAGVTPA